MSVACITPTAAALLQTTKLAADAKINYGLEGKLYLSTSGWLLMQVPNDIGHGFFATLNEPGVEMPTRNTNDPDAKFNAHVSVMSPDEIEKIGGPAKLNERGKSIPYTTGAVKTVDPPDWDGVSRVWYLTIQSPELEKIRKSYGLEPRRKGYDFHVTFGIRRKRVLQNNDIKKAAALGEIALWEEVPQKVAAFYKEARPVAQRLRSLVSKFPAYKSDKPKFWWHPESKRLNVSLPDDADAATENRWANLLQVIPGVHSVKIDHEWVPEGCIELKVAADLNWLGNKWQQGNAALGGPNPLTKTLLGGLLMGGAGYGAGTLIESLFPERYVERGRLRKTLGLTGAAVGAAPGLLQGHFNNKADGQGFLQGMLTHDSAPLLKTAGEAGGFGIRSIPVDAFNRMVWRDVRKGVQTAETNPYGTKDPWGSNEESLHTPPAVGAATTGLMTGIQAQTGSQIISPADLVRGIASAGVGLAVANVAGRTLGALAGLSPTAQEKLQDVGVFGGLLTSLVPPLFGR